MNQIESQSKCIDALKSFNNIIVTSRLYPPDAPQVATAIERAYNNIKSYLRLNGELGYSLKGEILYLNGQALTQEILDLFPNLVIYRQLRLLGLSSLVIRSEVDSFAFSQLISVFNASGEKIKNEGGGLEYITSLGLASYFPDDVFESDERAVPVDRSSSIHRRKLAKVRPELVACLFGKDIRPVIQAELQKKMAGTETAIDILAACVAHILRDIQKKKMIVASENFPLMQEQAEILIKADNRKDVAQGLAKVLVENLKAPALAVLLAQEYPNVFAGAVYEGLMVCLTTEQLSGIIIIYREQLEKARRIGGNTSSQVQFLGKALLLLINSEKGKHYLRTEKAKNLIHEGERERKKRRLEAGIKGFLQGNTSLLKSEEFVEYLPTAIRQIQDKKDGPDVALLLDSIISAFRDGTEEAKQSLLKSIVIISENFIADNQWKLLGLILEPLMEEVRKGVFGEILLERLVTLLQQVMQESWQARENNRGDSILNLFHQIRSGQIPHSAAMKAVVAKVQDRGIRRANLPGLLDGYLAFPKDETLRFRLILQGPVVLRFLIEALIKAEKAADRLQIIDLLTYSPSFLPSVVHERLQEHMAWYGKRNLIKLLGETGKEEDAESILPYLQHDDFRVQCEAFLTLYKISGTKRKRMLLRALEESSEPIKIEIIGALANFCDLEVAGKLSELLMSHEQFSEKNRNDLLLQLLETLGRCPCQQAYKGVTEFLQIRGQRAGRKIPEQIWSAAEKASKFLHNEIQEIRKNHVQASKLRKNALKQAAKLSKRVNAQHVFTGLPQEQTIRTLLSRDDKTAAVEQLMELIERVARMRNFVQAEKLREWLIEIDPAALSQIVQAAQIIDREKIASIDKIHLEIWGSLYDILDTDEFSTVFHALKNKKYANEEIIISQGAVQGALFFINSGQVKLYFDENGSDVLIKTMGRGDIFGADAFFEASVWTISASSVGTSEISILKLDALQEWNDTFPELESKLYSFCKKSEKIKDLIKRNSYERRLYQRYRISGRIVITLLDDRGRIGTNLKVELFDVSESGLSCLVRISQKEYGRLLLGKNMQITLPEVDRLGDGVILTGKILAVKKTYAVENDYSLHMKFDRLLDRKQLHDVVMALRDESQVIK